jgi:hypothetical protein
MVSSESSRLFHHHRDKLENIKTKDLGMFQQTLFVLVCPWNIPKPIVMKHDAKCHCGV